MESELLYTCPKHGGVHRSRAGFCPQCDARLVVRRTGLTAIIMDPVKSALVSLALLGAMALVAMALTS